MTQEEIVEICEDIGPVVSFKMVTDKDTGKAKGYGFCEYRDEETALSARRNLQGYKINGRELKVDFASKGGGASDRVCIGGPGLLLNNSPPQDQTGSASATETDYDKLVRHLATHYTQDQLNAYLEEIRVLATQDIQRAGQILLLCPQLPSAIAQAAAML